MIDSKWEDTGRQDQPLRDAGATDAEVFRDLTLRVRSTSAASRLTLSVEAVGCELPLVALVGSSPERGHRACSADDICGAAFRVPYERRRRAITAKGNE